MKKLVTMLLIASAALFAQFDDATLTATAESENVTGSAVAGAVTIDGKNYQQIGIRADIPIGKFGFGVDVQLLLDEEGSIRKEDWDEAEDYFNLIYYLRWAHKGDPFYVKVGGLDYSSLGYGIVVDGYSNMIEYPTYKRIGMEMSFEAGDFGGEILVNNYKELFEDEAGLLLGTRMTYKVAGDLTIGASFASDFNEYNGLRDSDDDGVPDEADYDAYDDDIVVERDYWVSQGASSSTIEAMINDGLIDPTDAENMQSQFKGKTSKSTIFGIDLSYPLVTSDFLNLDVYAQAAKIANYGWGFSAPGVLMNVGPLRINAEYRHTGGEFIFGYYNSTYELERASVIAATDENGNLSYKAHTRKEILKDMESLDGYFAGLGLNIFDYVDLQVNYQDLKGDSTDVKSLYGELVLNQELIPKISMAKGYYYQNNVEDFDKWKTPSTVLGYIVGFGLNEGASLNFNYRYTFEDKNGDGEIKGDNETIKSIGIGTSIIF